MVIQKRLNPTHKKRQGLHHKRGPHYLKVYWPYMPLVGISLIAFVLMNISGYRSKHGVLAYATNISIDSLLVSTNEQRINSNLSSLQLNAKLTAAAQVKANDMSQRNYWSHVTPDGIQPWAFINNSGYLYQKVGENLAYGFLSSTDTVKGWMNSAEHRANVLDSSYKDVGFGFANSSNFQNSGAETIVVAMYGNPKPNITGTPLVQSNTSAPPIIEPATQTISNLQTYTNGVAPWSVLFIGIICGFSITYLLIKNALSLKKLTLRGEAYFQHHPLLDSLLLIVLMGSIILTRTAGFIK